MTSSKACISISFCLAITLALLSVSPTFAVNPTPTIPAGSKIFVAPGDGFDTFLAAALSNKKVPVTVVADKEKADYILEASSESEKASWSKVLFMGQTGSKEEASVRIINVKTSEVVFAYAVHKRNSVHGKQSTAEACAKHLKEVVR
jgi:hypothetical protein